MSDNLISSSLERDLNNNNNPKRCNACGIIVSRKSDISRHRVTHREGKEFHCEWPNCPFQAHQKAGLETHMNKHTGAKPYLCNYSNCELAFGDPGCKIRHMKRMHGYTPRVTRPKARNPTLAMDPPIKTMSKSRAARLRRLNSSLPSYPSPYMGSLDTLPSLDLQTPYTEFIYPGSGGSLIKIEDSFSEYEGSANMSHSTLAYGFPLFNSAVSTNDSTSNNYASFDVGRESLFNSYTEAPGVQFSRESAAFMTQNSLGLFFNNFEQAPPNNMCLPLEYQREAYTNYLPQLPSPGSSVSSILDDISIF